MNANLETMYVREQ